MMYKKVFNTVILLFVTGQLLFSQQQKLTIPDTLSGPQYYLTLQHGQQTFLPGITTATMGANGDLLGPTLFLQKGQQVSIKVENGLGEPTTIHWHGLHVAPENDGGPHTPIAAGEIWNPQFTVMDHAATFWYHPHLHHKTNEHVSKGIAGLIIVRDSLEAALPLPRTYGLDDIPVILQTKELDALGQIVSHTHQDKLLLINGVQNPYVDVPAQWVRFRVLNGSSERSFYIGLDNNLPFYQIASDAALLNRPVSLTRLLLSPGERAELMIDLSQRQGQNLVLKSFAAELPNGIYGARFPGMGQGMVLNGYNPNPLNGQNFDLLTLKVGPPLAGINTTLPQQLNNLVPISSLQADTSRNFVFMPDMMGPNQLNGSFMINDRHFEMDFINEIVTLDNVEIWELRNQSGISHPFHIHNVPFYILSRNGLLPPENEAGLKDVVLVRPGETVRIITKFTDFADSPIPYMYHCHLLTHEDHGMMGQFLVQSRGTSVFENPVPGKLACFPNPANEEVYVKLGDAPIPNDALIQIFDNKGRIIKSTYAENGKISVQLFAAGVYLLRVAISEAIFFEKIIVY